MVNFRYQLHGASIKYYCKLYLSGFLEGVSIWNMGPREEKKIILPSVVGQQVYLSELIKGRERKNLLSLPSWWNLVPVFVYLQLDLYHPCPWFLGAWKWTRTTMINQSVLRLVDLDCSSCHSKQAMCVCVLLILLLCGTQIDIFIYG